jgi:adenylate kinase
VADGAEEGGGGRMKVVLLGPPGSGKGTQAAVLSQMIGVPAISTGELLRDAVAAGTELGRRVDGIMSSGGLVDDDTMTELVRERLARRTDGRGFLLDGYPRSLPQAETLDRILGQQREGLDAVVLVEVPQDELVRRALARKRKDDVEDVVRERLRVYREITMPVIGYYRQRGLLREIDGYRPIAEVTGEMLSALGLEQRPETSG